MISTLLSISGCQSLWYQFLNFAVDIAPDRFTFEEDHEKLSIPIVTSYPLENNNHETEYLIITSIQRQITFARLVDTILDEYPNQNRNKIVKDIREYIHTLISCGLVEET